MARVDITIPNDLLARARAAGLVVSHVAAAALAEELDRRDKLVALDRYLVDLDAELGPVSTDEQDAARHWADEVLGDPSGKVPHQAGRFG